jgi:hypothetical protein
VAANASKIQSRSYSVYLLLNRGWIRDFRHELTPAALTQAVLLWKNMQHIILQDNIKDCQLEMN